MPRQITCLTGAAVYTLYPPSANGRNPDDQFRLSEQKLSAVGVGLAAGISSRMAAGAGVKALQAGNGVGMNGTLPVAR